jgi:thiamine monophosphate kinase
MIVLVYSWIQEGAPRSTEVVQFSSEKKLEDYVNKTLLGLEDYEILFCAEYTTEIEFKTTERAVRLSAQRIDPSKYQPISIRGL